MGTNFFPGGKVRPGRDADPSPPSSGKGKNRVELYLYSPTRAFVACDRVKPTHIGMLDYKNLFETSHEWDSCNLGWSLW